MDDSKCKPFLTDILKDNYRNIICAKSSNGEIINSKANKIHEASDIREVCNKLGNIIPLFLSNFVVTHSTKSKQWYRGSPTYTKITNTISTTTVFGLCMCK